MKILNFIFVWRLIAWPISICYYFTLKAVDWWALGVLMFEMLAGYPPYYDDNSFNIYEKILSGKIEWPKHIDAVTKDIIKKLLTQDRNKRLGSLKIGAEEVKRHK